MKDIEIKWYAPENTDGTATLKQHCFKPVYWVGRYMTSEDGYMANEMLCGGGHIGEDHDHRSPWSEVDAEPFNRDNACKKCIQKYRSLFGKEPS